MKEATMPRLELAAAYVGSTYHCLAKEELMIKDLKEKLWVDSKIVLGYILNKTRRYKTYVANKVQKILAVTNEEDWDYVDTKINPADYCSRGISPKDRIKMNNYFKGPEFLWQEEGTWERKGSITEYKEDDEEVKKLKQVRSLFCDNHNVLNSTKVSLK